MLLEFRVGNYLSFKDTVTLSMEAASISEHEDSNVFEFDKYKLLKSAVVYGANASGKSNLIKAMGFMEMLVFSSSKDTQVAEPIKVENFRLSTETENEPSFFEIIFICEQKKYRYGFKVDKKRVYSEWLFFNPSRQEAKLFLRDEDDIKISTTYFREGKGLEDKTRPNALFLSVVAQFNGKISKKILEWFNRFRFISGLSDESYMGFTVSLIEKEDFKQKLLEYLKIADLGIDNVNIEKGKIKISELPENLSIQIKDKNADEIDRVGISTLHSKYDNENKRLPSKVKFEFKSESEGTRKFVGILGPLLDTLDKGYVLVVDELDARLHPFITRFIIQLFHSKQTNPNNAQLIFATHDTNLLDKDLFRRDQIWFTEKDQYGATDLYSLVEYKNVRKDASYEKDYIAGKYGAVPFIRNFEVL
jgi:uncharacterized protein